MKNTSIWLDTTKGKDYPTLEADTSIHTLIVGGGIVGLTTAYYMAQATKDIMVVEADKIGYGASGRNTGKLTFQHGLIYNDLWKQHGKEGALLYYKAQQEAIESIADIIQDHKIDCDFEECDALLYTQDETRIADFQEEYQTYLDLDIPCSYVSDSDIQHEIVAGIRVEHQAKYNPYRYLLGLSDILDEMEIQIYENSFVKHIVKDETGYNVMIHNVCIHAHNIVLATQFPILDHRHFYFTRLYPKVSHIATVQQETWFGNTMMIRDEEPLISYNQTKIQDATYLLCGGIQHDCGKEDVEKEEDWIHTLMHEWQVSNIAYEWSTQDYLSFDHFPLVGPLDDEHAHLYFASGMQKWGNTNGNIAAKLLCSYLLKQDSPYQAYFNPHRTSSYLTPKFLQLNFKVMKNLLQSHMVDCEEAYPQLGKASIVSLHNHTYGMYRDEQDEVYVVDITCPHLGCICSFNEVDKTWDCPCHGSRFSIRGDIIKGPATSPLHAYGDGLNPIDPHLFK